MMGTLTSVAFLAICLTVTNAFMVWAPTVTSSDPAYGRQASSLIIGAPLGGTGRRIGAGGSLSQTDGNDAAEAKKICRPRVPTARDYTASRRSICALRAFKGPEPEISEDGNATVPIVGGVDALDGGDSGVASGHQNETLVQHRTTPHEHFFVEKMSVTVISSAADESASTTQEEGDGNTHGAFFDDMDATIDATVATDTDTAADVDITTDTGVATAADLTTDADLTTEDNLELRNHEQLRRDASSNPISDEAHDTTSDDTALDEELPVGLTADGVASDATFILQGVVDDAMEPVPHDVDNITFHEELSFDVTRNNLFGETSTSPSAPGMPDDAVSDVMGSVLSDANDSTVDKELPNQYVADCLNDAIRRATFDRMEDDDVDDTMGSDGEMLKVVLFDGDMDGFVWSMLQDALVRGLLDSKDRILSSPMNHYMWSKLHDAISGPVASELADSFDDMITSLLHHAFFGPAASEAVFSFAKTADEGQLVVGAYTQTVVELYDKFKYARYRRTANRAANAGDIAAQEEVSGDTDGDAVGSVPHDIDNSAFHEELRFALTAHSIIAETSSRPPDPTMAERTAVDEFTSVLYDEIYDQEAKEVVGYNDPVNELVLSVVRDAFARRTTSEDLMLDAAMDDSMWSKLHESITERATPESENLADALDEVATCLLHDAFFGPEASKAVSALAKSAGGRQKVVDGYVRAVTELYGNFKQARGPNPDSKPPAARKVGGWLKKFWRRIRRKER